MVMVKSSCMFRGLLSYARFCGWFAFDCNWDLQEKALAHCGIVSDTVLFWNV